MESTSMLTVAGMVPFRWHIQATPLTSQHSDQTTKLTSTTSTSILSMAIVMSLCSPILLLNTTKSYSQTELTRSTPYPMQLWYTTQITHMSSLTIKGTHSSSQTTTLTWSIKPTTTVLQYTTARGSSISYLPLPHRKFGMILSALITRQNTLITQKPSLLLKTVLTVRSFISHQHGPTSPLITISTTTPYLTLPWSWNLTTTIALAITPPIRRL